MNFNAHDDDDIKRFKEEYPDVYEFVIKILDGNFDDAILRVFEDEYGKDCLDYILNIISGKATEKDIQDFREEYGDEICNAIVKMVQKRNLAIKDTPEPGPLREKFKKGDFIGQKYEVIDILGEGGFEPKVGIFEQPFPIDYQLKEYIIKSVLGRGGFGITYLVLDRNLHKTFALKEYFPIAVTRRGQKYDIEAKEEIHKKNFEKGRGDFLREARILAAFKHPNIISAVRVFEANNTAYILMEYEKGRSLQNQIKNRHKNFSEQEVLSIFLPVLEGLEELHKKGFIHRDIKPDNIFIRENGTPVLIDFGAARNFLVAEGLNMSIILTPHYAPIEQFTSDVPQGPYTDIYSLGCVLYYLTTGRVPLPAVERMRGKDIESAESLKRGAYSDVFLRAIDLAMQIDYRKRPQTLIEWRKLFDPSAYHYDLISVAENIQYKIFSSYKNWILDQFGMSIILHEAVLFSVILPLIDLEWRLQKHFDPTLLYKIYQHLIDQNRALEILTSDKPERTQKLLRNDIDMQSLFNERYRQYSASYLIDREQENWDFRMTASRFVENTISRSSTSSAIPDWLIQYGSDLIDFQRGRIKRDLQKIDPRWGRGD